MGYNTLKLYGNQVCDYLHIQNIPVENDDVKNVDSEPKEWDSDTLMLSRFNNDLVGGSSAVADSIVGYDIRRRKGADSHTEYVCTLKDNKDKKSQNFIIDYSVVGNSTYTYYLYPQLNSRQSLTPFMTKEAEAEWSYWSLMVVDETENENVFHLSKMFKFELNFEEGNMNNNAAISITQNFTKYPTVQYGMSNYWSGSLKSLCGFISCNNDEYIQTPNMINEIKSLTSDSRRKFLKNSDGDIWEVKITAPINITTEPTVSVNLKTVELQWCEVGDAKNISIINNPDVPTVSWVLTETGEAMPYIDYVWNDIYKWDNSYRWTAREDNLQTDMSNMGRSIYGKDGEN